MSIWSDMEDRGMGDTIREEDKIRSKEAISYLIIEKLKCVNWQNEYPMTATPNLLQWQVYKYLKEQIPELE